MQTIYLNGPISKFGENFTFECANIRDIFKLLSCQLDGFRQYLINAADIGVGFEIIRGDRVLEHPEELLLSIQEEDIIISEIPFGSKSGGAKILAAVAIVGLMWVTGGFGSVLLGPGALSGGWAFGSSAIAGGLVGLTAAGIAINLAIAGLTQIMAPGPEVDSDQSNSYLFNGPVNSVKQGQPVPVAYGELIVGGAPINVFFETHPILEV